MTATLVAIGVTIGSPDTTGQVSVTATDGAALLALALTDTTALAALITTTQTNTTTADNDAATDVTNTTTADNDAGTDVTNTTAADTQVGTVETDIDTFAASVIAITGDTYNGTTRQFTFGGATGLTHAQWATVGAQLNTALAALVLAKTDTAVAVTSAAATKTATAAAKSSAATTKAATAAAKTASAAESTTTVRNDIIAAQANFASDVTVRTDTSKCTQASVLSGALQAAIQLVISAGILP